MRKRQITLSVLVTIEAHTEDGLDRLEAEARERVDDRTVIVTDDGTAIFWPLEPTLPGGPVDDLERAFAEAIRIAKESREPGAIILVIGDAE